MREMFTRYLGKLVENTKDLLAHPSAEQATQDKETAASSLQGKLATPQEKRERPTLPALEKSKKRRIPFVALALVLVFTSLCVIAIVGGPITLIASANSSSADLHHSTFLPLDSTPSLDGPPAGTPTQNQPDPLDIPFTSPCTDGNFTSYATYKSDGSPDKTNTVCGNKNDFQWGNADLSCIVNPKYPQGIFPASTTGTTPTPNASTTFQFSGSGHNQNTCVTDHTCYSNNASEQDESGTPTIHDEVLGDDIICWNNACSGVNIGATNDAGAGTITDQCGSGKPYDKFACAPFLQETFGQNTTPYTLYINPTAYNPLGFAEFPNANVSMHDGNANGQTIDASGDMPGCTSDDYWTCPDGDKINIIMNEGSNEMVDVFTSAAPHEINSDDFYYNGNPEPYNINNQGTVLMGYTVACNQITSGWAFPCSDTNASSGQPFVNYKVGQSLDEGQVNAAFIKSDWLSGNADPTLDNPTIIAGDMTQGAPGHLEYTYLHDTVNQPGIQILFPYSLALGFLLIAPVLVMIGYQFLWASWTFGRANAMEAFGRMILSVSAIAISYYVASMLISVTNTFNIAIVNFHATLSYPDVSIGGQTSTFTLVPQGENDPSSFRGIVVPISRWGCIANDFVSLLSSKFWTDAAQFIPFVGGAIKFAGNIANAVDFAHHAGEFIVLLLTINLCTQVFIRVVLLNYYILTGPLAFGCWGLPGGVGQKVVSSWTKGFLSLLFAQTAQIFVLTTFPLILPDFPNLPIDRFGFLSMVFAVLPRVLVLSVTIKVPTVMGTGATKAVAQAGTVVAGAVAAAGGAAMSTV